MIRADTPIPGGYRVVYGSVTLATVDTREEAARARASHHACGIMSWIEPVMQSVQTVWPVEAP